MFQRKFSFLTFLICMLLSVSCGTDPNPLSVPTVAPTEPPLIIDPEEPTPSEEPTPTEEVTEEVTEEPESPPVETEEEPAPTETSSENSIKVGSKEFTEQLLLGKMLFLTLQDAGYDVVEKAGIDQAVMRQAVEEGEVDMYWEYTGTALSRYHGLPPKFTDPETALITVRKLDEAKNLVWFDQTDFNDTYSLMVLPSNVERGIVTISDLANFMNANDSPLNVCVEDDFFTRPDGLLPLQERYGFEFKPENIKVIEYDQLYEGLRSGECDVAEGFTTDGRITAWDFRNLVDDQAYFPAYNIAPVVQKSILDQHPNLKDKLDNFMSDVGPRLDDNTMGLLNACVDLGPDGEFDTGDEKSVEEVARAFLSDTELDCLPRQIVVGSKKGNDYFLIGKALVLLLERFGYDVVDNTGLGATNVVREALINKEIDIYWEELNTALTVFQEFPRGILDLDSETILTLVKKDEEPRGVQWLEPATNIKTTYTLMVRASSAAEQNLNTIEDLASFMNANGSPFTLCVEDNFHTRSDGLLGVQDVYGFTFKAENVLPVEANQTYQNLQNGVCDVAQGLTTGSSAAYGLQILEDTQNAFYPLIPAPVIRQEILNSSPELIELVQNLSRDLDSDLMAALNLRLQVGADGVAGSGDEESPESMARLLLCQFNLLNDCPIAPIEITPPDNNEENTGEPTNPEATPIPPVAACQEIVVDGDFENEGNWGFGSTASPPSFTTERVHSGESALYLGIMEQNDDRFSQSVAKQRISIPADAQSVTLSYWYNPISADSNDRDVQGGLIFAADESFVRRKLMRSLSDEQLWNQQTHDLSAFIGEDVVLYFYVDNDGNGLPSGMYLDDVSVQVCSG